MGPENLHLKKISRCCWCWSKCHTLRTSGLNIRGAWVWIPIPHYPSCALGNLIICLDSLWVTWTVCYLSYPFYKTCTKRNENNIFASYLKTYHCWYYWCYCERSCRFMSSQRGAVRTLKLPKAKGEKFREFKVNIIPWSTLGTSMEYKWKGHRFWATKLLTCVQILFPIWKMRIGRHALQACQEGYSK